MNSQRVPLHRKRYTPVTIAQIGDSRPRSRLFYSREQALKCAEGWGGVGWLGTVGSSPSVGHRLIDASDN